MRVALFFDGKNFYSGWREAAKGRRIDFVKLADWLVKKAGGTSLWGAYYYTSIEESISSQSDTQQKLAGFLDMLETQPGFFVHTFKRKMGGLSCIECTTENRYTIEKEVDISMVTNMLKLAAVNAFDTVVLMSGDADYAPALEAIRSLGKQAYIASWAGTGVSKRIRHAAFNHIDMLEGIDTFEREGNLEEDGLELHDDDEEPVEIIHVTGDDSMDAFLTELQQAQSKFSGGYVGLGYFLTRWRSTHLDTTPEYRRRVLDKLLAEGLVETYNAPDGALAIRVSDKSLSEMVH